jgi:uncharacterized protein DUF4157
MGEDGGGRSKKPAPPPHEAAQAQHGDAVPPSALYQPPGMSGDVGAEPWQQIQGRRVAAEQPPARWMRMQQERADVGASIQRRLVAQRKASGPAGAAQIPTGSGSPLSSEVKRSIGPHLGANLDGVRVHTGGDSADAASKMGARAFTVGTDVHFGAGEYAPGTKEGDRLLAHELTHTVQAQKSNIQRKAEPGDDGNGDGEHAVSKEGEPAELEADAVGDHVAEAIHGEGDAREKKAGDKAGGGAGKEKAPAIGAKLVGVGRKIFRAKNDKTTGKTDHGQERSDQAKSDPHRQVGDSNRVVRQGRRFEDTETGHIIYVDGDRVVVTTKDGKEHSRFKNTRANTQARIRSGKWKPMPE